MPAEQVSWRDCQALVKENERVSGGAFLLPTEAEWEDPAIVGASSRNAFDLPAPIAADVGPPSRLGLFSTLRNVWQWCSSAHWPYAYVASDGREDASAPGLRVLRGGTYADSPEWSHTSTRHAERPDRRLRLLGVRLSRNVPGERSTEVRHEAYPPSYGE